MLFYVFSVILVFSALGVIFSRQAIHSALFLILSFFTAAALCILIKAEFLAVVLLVVYVGAIMILFLFVVMMVGSDDRIREGFRKNLFVGIPVGILVALEMAFVIMRSFPVSENSGFKTSSQVGTTKEIGIALFTDYLYAFEISAAVLLVAIVSVVALSFRRRKDAKYNDISAALSVKRKDRIRLIKMKAESETREISE